MKKSLLITTSLLTLWLVTGIYAQATWATGTILDKMKAVAHSFTLAATLNPSDTGLTSDPVKGKKTGDILTAGEYNRLLELVSEGGSGGGSLHISFKKDYSKNGNSTVPTTEDIGSHDFCALTRYGEGNVSDSTAGYCKVEKWTNGIWTVSIQALNNNINCQVTCFAWGGGTSWTWSQVSSRAVAVRASGHTLAIPSGITDWPDTIVCEGYGGMAGWTQILNLSLTTSWAAVYWAQDGIGIWFNASTGVVTDAQRVNATCGASAGNIASICAAGRCIYASGTSAWSSSWVGVPLTDTASFDQACEYRFQLNLNGVTDTSYTGQNPLLYASGVDPSSITYVSHVSQVTHINSATKSILRINGVSTYTVTKIEKRCN